MSAQTDDAMAVLLLATHVTDRAAPPLKAHELWRLLDAVPAPGRLFRLDDAGLDAATAPARVDGARVRALFDDATAVAFAVDALDQSGVWVRTALDDGYPARWRERLGTGAPPLVYGAGPVRLSAAGGLGIVGSRSVDADGGEVAAAAARLAVEAGVPVVSGAARGVDQVAMAAAEAAGGDVVGVLADALGRRLREPETRRAIGDERVCLCTPYSPTARFSAGRAMGRNRLIYALTDVTFVVASDHDSGGTWSGAVEAVKHGFTRVAVWRGPGEGPGNSPLVERGATAIRDLDELAAMLAATEAGAAARPGPPAEHRVEQLGLTL